jgi:hypothetical protein
MIGALWSQNAGTLFTRTGQSTSAAFSNPFQNIGFTLRLAWATCLEFPIWKQCLALTKTEKFRLFFDKLSANLFLTPLQSFAFCMTFNDQAPVNPDVLRITEGRAGGTSTQCGGKTAMSGKAGARGETRTRTTCVGGF